VGQTLAPRAGLSEGHKDLAGSTIVMPK
jgi:hypothetical protein